jgi:hypothetical protein
LCVRVNECVKDARRCGQRTDRRRWWAAPAELIAQPGARIAGDALQLSRLCAQTKPICGDDGVDGHGVKASWGSSAQLNYPLTSQMQLVKTGIAGAARSFELHLC